MTRCLVVLGQEESRSHAAAVLVEEMAADRLPVVVLDTRGVWHGLLQSSDGARPGLPVQVFGADGGIELRANAGRLLADCALALGRPMVLDLSKMPGQEAALVASELVDQLLLRSPRTLHLVLDDAHVLAGEGPVSCAPGLVALSSGERAGCVGVTLVTEGPALVGRRILGKADALLVGPNDARRDEDLTWLWLESHADRKTAAGVARSIASMRQDEAWICSPDWLGGCHRVTLRARATRAATNARRSNWPSPPPSLAATRELERLHMRLGDVDEVASVPQRPPPSGLPSAPTAKRSRKPREKPRRGRPVADLTLSPDEKEALERHAAEGGARTAIAQRARIVLACAEGRLNGDVARSFGVTNQMVGRWRRRFVDLRMEGLLRKDAIPAGRRTASRAGVDG